MASQDFVDFETRVVAEWLNDVNDHAYNEISSNAHPASKISFVATGTIGSLNVQDAIEEVAASIGSGGGGGGASTLNELTDVNTAGATSGQVLKFDGANWVPGVDVTSGGGGTDADTLDGLDSTHYLNYANLTNKPTIPSLISDLSNVSNTVPASGQVLKWNGSQWAPAADEQGTGGGGGKVLGFATAGNPTSTEMTTTSTSYSTATSVGYTKQSATSRLIIQIGFHVTATPSPTSVTTALAAVRINGGVDNQVTRQRGHDAFNSGAWTNHSGSGFGTWVDTSGAGAKTIDLRIAASVGGAGFRTKLYTLHVWEVEV